MQIEKWLLAEMLTKLIELRDKCEMDRVEGEHKFPFKSARTFEHCDLWWQVHEQENWLEVKTITLTKNEPKGKIQDVIDDLEKRTRLRATDIFHHLAIVFPIPNSETSQWMNQITKVYRDAQASELVDWNFNLWSDRSLCMILASFNPTSDI